MVDGTPPASADDSQRATIVSHSQVLAGKHEAFAAWEVERNRILREQPGFIDVEVWPPVIGQQPDWVIVEHFQSSRQAVAWLESAARASADDDAIDLLAAPDSVNIVAGGVGKERPKATVTAVITNLVAPGKDADFRQWKNRIRAVQSTFPGYQGADVQPPIEGVNANWVTFLRFDTAENLRGWLDSPECAELTVDSEPIMEKAEYRMARTSFESWLPRSEQAQINPPPNWKVSMIVLLVLYPIVMLEIVFLYPPLAAIGTGPTTFIANAIGVTATGFLLVPWASNVLKKWLVPPADQERKTTIIGSVGIVAAYVVCVVLMSILSLRVLGS